MRLDEYVPGHIWLVRYPVHYVGTRLDARMTVLRLTDNSLLLHSPCEITPEIRQALLAIGPISAIVAPGTFHTLHVQSAQAAFPEAATFICPGIEGKCPAIRYDGILGDIPPERWRGQLDQVLMRGSRWITEVAFFHRSSQTLILVDLVENITDATPDTNWQLKLWWKVVFHMWNNPKPAPEYQLGWADKALARTALRAILAWPFERVVIAHGELIGTNARAVLEAAWAVPLSDSKAFSLFPKLPRQARNSSP